MIELPITADRLVGMVYGRAVVERRLSRSAARPVAGSTARSRRRPGARTCTTRRPGRGGHPAGGLRPVPSTLPAPPPGGATRAAGSPRRLAGAGRRGYVEVLNYPFIAPGRPRRPRAAPDDARRHAVRLANPLSEEEPELRTTLLAGLLPALRRNDGRGSHDLALFETGLVFRPEATPARARQPGVEGRPSDDEIAALDAALPHQPRGSP